MGTNRSIDHSRLEDTLGGRLAQSGLTLVYYAIPDFVADRARQLALRLGILGGAAALAVRDVRRRPSDRVEEKEPLSPLGVASLILVAAFALAVSAGLLWVDNRVADWFAKHLVARGIKYPYSVIGVALAALVYIAAEAEHIRNERQGQ